MTDSTNTSSNSQDTALKLATAIALIKSKLSSSSCSESDSQRWKRKVSFQFHISIFYHFHCKTLIFSASSQAKERKRELLILKQQLKDIQGFLPLFPSLSFAFHRRQQKNVIFLELFEVLDGSERDLIPEITTCKCHFFENCGKLSPRGLDLGGDHRWTNEVLHRRFLRQGGDCSFPLPICVC